MTGSNGMLVFVPKTGEAIEVEIPGHGKIVVQILEIRNAKARVGVIAPPHADIFQQDREGRRTEKSVARAERFRAKEPRCDGLKVNYLGPPPGLPGSEHVPKLCILCCKPFEEHK